MLESSAIAKTAAHHGQLIRDLYGLNLPIPDSWKSRYALQEKPAAHERHCRLVPCPVCHGDQPDRSLSPARRHCDFSRARDKPARTAGRFNLGVRF
jgi:hypothetical protein